MAAKPQVTGVRAVGGPLGVRPRREDGELGPTRTPNPAGNLLGVRSRNLDRSLARVRVTPSQRQVRSMVVAQLSVYSRAGMTLPHREVELTRGPPVEVDDLRAPRGRNRSEVRADL